MDTYGATLATVVALVVTGAAVAGFVAACGLLRSSMRRRERLEAAVHGAALLAWTLQHQETAAPDVPYRDDERRGPSLRELRPAEWNGLYELRSAPDPRPELAPLDELELLPQDLIGWAALNGPAALRSDQPLAMSLVEVDRDVRTTIAAGGGPSRQEPGTQDGPGPQVPPPVAALTPAERQERLKRIAATWPKIRFGR